MENEKRIALSKDMEYIVNVNRLAVIVKMFCDTMYNLNLQWYPEELRPTLNKFRNEDLVELNKVIFTWMMDHFYRKGE